MVHGQQSLKQKRTGLAPTATALGTCASLAFVRPWSGECEMNLAAREQPIMVNRQNGGVAVVHIRFEGRSHDIPQPDLDVGPASSDHEIKQALARHLDVAEAKLRDYVIDR